MKRLTQTIALLFASALSFAAPTIDGTIKTDTGWPSGSSIAVQRNYTQFGNVTATSTGGSEIDVLYAYTDATTLYLGVTGNFEPNGNNCIIWIDTAPGGSNPYNLFASSTPQPPYQVTPFTGFQTAGSDLSGLKFDAGFAPEWIIQLNNSGNAGAPNGQTTYVDLYDVPGNAVYYLGSVDTSGANTTAPFAFNTTVTPTPPAAFSTFAMALNDSNVDGVNDDKTDVNNGNGINAVTAVTGTEISIPLSALNVTSLPNIKVFAMITGGGSNYSQGPYLSNQALPSLNIAAPTTTQIDNLGFVIDHTQNPTVALDFATIPGKQFVVVPDQVSGKVNLSGRVTTSQGVKAKVTSVNLAGDTFTDNVVLDATGNYKALVVPSPTTVRVKPQGYLSVTPTLTGTTLQVKTAINGDLNNDDVIDDSDLLIVINNFLNPAPAGTFDATGDNVLDDSDLLAVINHFLLKGEGL